MANIKWFLGTLSVALSKQLVYVKNVSKNNQIAQWLKENLYKRKHN